MTDELTELLDTAIYKEIASQAFYIAGQKQTRDTGAITLMKELAEEELKHSRLLKQLKDRGFSKEDWHPQRVPDLKMSSYLVGGDTLENAGIQDTLLFAIKREQESVDFYSRMMSVLRDRSARELCSRLVQEEIRHKFKLETLYDDMLRAAEF